MVGTRRPQAVIVRKNLPESSADLHWESQLQLLARRNPLPAMPLDMPQSLCVLDHAGTGREGNSAKHKENGTVMG